VDLANRKRTADIEGDIDEPSTDGNRSDNEIFLPDGNAVSRGNSNKTPDIEDIHVDSHAENDKCGSKNESEIGEKLEEDIMKPLTKLLWSSGPQWGETHEYRLQPYLVTESAGGQLNGRNLPPTLQFIGCTASKPANIRIMAMRAVRRQLE